MRAVTRCRAHLSTRTDVRGRGYGEHGIVPWFPVMLCLLPVLVPAVRLAGVREWRDAVVVAASAAFLLALLVERLTTRPA